MHLKEEKKKKAVYICISCFPSIPERGIFESVQAQNDKEVKLQVNSLTWSNYPGEVIQGNYYFSMNLFGLQMMQFGLKALFCSLHSHSPRTTPK